MTEQHTNPLVAGKGNIGRKVTLADLGIVCAEMNVTAAAYHVPWRFAVQPNAEGKMAIRKLWDDGRIG